MRTRTTLPIDRGQLGEILVAELPWLVRPATRLTRDADVAEDCAPETIFGLNVGRTSCASLASPLRCWRARRHVSGYLDGELDDPTRQAIEGSPGDLSDLPTAVRRARRRRGGSGQHRASAQGR